MSSQTGATPRPDTDLLDEVQRRRAGLRASMGVLERALASPARAGGADAWGERLLAALRELYAEFRQHVDITEGPAGLYAELALFSPRLAHSIDRLAAEHAEIGRRLEELLTLADADDPVPGAGEVRRAGTDLLVALMHHRQRGADLVFEAYELDIGGET